MAANTMSPDEQRHNHAEPIEQLRRLNTGLELLVQQHDERQLRELAGIRAEFTAALRYAIQAAQGARRGEARPSP